MHSNEMVMELQLMSQSLSSSPLKTQIQHYHIIKTVCLVMELGADSLKSSCRKQKTVDMRIITAQLLRENGYTLKQIAQLLHRDRTTVMAQLRNYQTLVSVDVAFKALDKKIREALCG